MTYPVGPAPDGAYVVGSDYGQSYDETNAMALMTGGVRGSFSDAQDRFKAEYISAPLFNGEVVRLDNRIDEIVVGTERAILWTFSEYGVWTKHAAAYKVVVDVISGGSGGSSGTNGSGSGAGGLADSPAAGSGSSSRAQPLKPYRHRSP
ncbi:hypothetical protein GS966_28815 [Rhodococcus hoagii]|uniref:Uncharacterized protein n=1 Tax=Rhodococcus hoagii TaxID=43767 RepID=A0A9Q2PCS7_RHOHA|nr:hypothetical protein [Prescottella equi]NKZ93731.1 hypothetical protein [Prescottella equi]